MIKLKKIQITHIINKYIYEQDEYKVALNTLRNG